MKKQIVCWCSGISNSRHTNLLNRLLFDIKIHRYLLLLLLLISLYCQQQQMMKIIVVALALLVASVTAEVFFKETFEDGSMY
jgi:hypothetical protein